MKRPKKEYRELDNLSKFYKKIEKLRGVIIDDELGSGFVVKLTKELIMKIELKHLVAYLPYGLRAEILEYESDYVGNQYDDIIGLVEWSKNKDWCCLTAGGSKPSFDRIKPILRPLSDLTNEIEVNGERFVPIERLEMYGFYDKQCLHKNQVQSISFIMMQYLFEWHFDVFSLIPDGLAIDVNEIVKDVNNDVAHYWN